MTLHARRIIYLIFIFIFLVVTPVIILYATGYRYNFQKHKIQKTGILILKSKPEGAKIYLNNKLEKTFTPARITNLLPGEYLINIAEEGFYPWQKILPVESSLATFAEDIVLFKKNLPLQIISDRINFFALAPNKQKLVYLQNQEVGEEIWLLDLKASKKILIYRSSEKNSKILDSEWSEDSQRILITIVDEPSKSQKFVVWDSRTQEVSIYQKLNDFYFDFKNIKNKFIDGSLFDDELLVDSPPEFVTTINKKTNDLTVMRSDTGEIVLQTKARKASWLVNEKKLLVIKDFEIWIYDLPAGQELFLTRYSKEIQKALWVNNNYILILLENTLRIIELDERDQRNITDLLVLDRIDNFDLDAEKQKIYFIGEIANKKGVYELQY